jgi:putative membrane protein
MMRLLSHLLVLVVALVHVWFMVLEMVLWNHPVGQRIFNMTPEFSAASAVLAANQGLYNGFLAAGLLWGLLTGRREVKVFFLACIVVAGVYGGLTAKMTILYVQALPALVALLFVAFVPAAPSRRSTL